MQRAAGLCRDLMRSHEVASGLFCAKPSIHPSRVPSRPREYLYLGGLLETVGVLLEEVLDPFGRDRLGALEGQPQATVPEELSEDAEGAADAKEDRVVCK